MPFGHGWCWAHCVFDMHDVKQAVVVASQRNGVQSTVVAGAQAPLPSQWRAGVSVATRHEPAAQTVVAG